MYDPTTGRFLSEDPLGFDATDPNLFRYVLNRPTDLVDPEGTQPERVWTQGTAGVLYQGYVFTGYTRFPLTTFVQTKQVKGKNGTFKLSVYLHQETGAFASWGAKTKIEFIPKLKPGRVTSEIQLVQAVCIFGYKPWNKGRMGVFRESDYQRLSEKVVMGRAHLFALSKHVAQGRPSGWVIDIDYPDWWGGRKGLTPFYIKRTVDAEFGDWQGKAIKSRPGSVAASGKVTSAVMYDRPVPWVDVGIKHAVFEFVTHAYDVDAAPGDSPWLGGIRWGLLYVEKDGRILIDFMYKKQETHARGGVTAALKQFLAMHANAPIRL